MESTKQQPAGKKQEYRQANSLDHAYESLRTIRKVYIRISTNATGGSIITSPANVLHRPQSISSTTASTYHCKRQDYINHYHTCCYHEQNHCWAFRGKGRKKEGRALEKRQWNGVQESLVVIQYAGEYLPCSFDITLLTRSADCVEFSQGMHCSSYGGSGL